MSETFTECASVHLHMCIWSQKATSGAICFENYFILYVGHFAYIVSMHHVHAWCSGRPERGI